jgi:hypothetical protein
MALNSGHSWALWAEQWFCEFGYNEIQTFFWQDNQSVIAMMDKKGVAPKDGSRHIQIRFFPCQRTVTPRSQPTQT